MEVSSWVEKPEEKEYDHQNSLNQEVRRGKRDHQDGL
jgi:hypothetical protein